MAISIALTHDEWEKTKNHFKMYGTKKRFIDETNVSRDALDNLLLKGYGADWVVDALKKHINIEGVTTVAVDTVSISSQVQKKLYGNSTTN